MSVENLTSTFSRKRRMTDWLLFTIPSFITAGINWNAGENVGLVLRGPSGRFHPLDYVLQVFHHELAHCQFMNHVPSQHGRLTAQLSKECKKLQQRGYFGDGEFRIASII